MRLVCLHADTVDALKRLKIQFEDLTPTGLWSSQYHLLGMTVDQVDALDVFGVEAEDITPAQLIQATASPTPRAAARAGEDRRPSQGQAGQPQGAAGSQRPAAAAGTAALAGTPGSATSDQPGRDQMRSAGGAESEVRLAQARDGGGRAGEAKTEAKPDVKAAAQSPPAAGGGTQGAQAAATPPQKNAAAKSGAPAAPQPPTGRKGQPAPGQGGGSQRYGTTRLRISVAGKYTEATVANGKIVVGGRAFDSPDQAAAELTKSRGDWTFWEYYDSADGKWRMLTRDWDTVLKSATPGGR